MLIEFVLMSVNHELDKTDTHERFQFGGTLPLKIMEKDIFVTGISGFVIWKGQDPWCIIEHKKHETDESLFEQGVRQALVYVAEMAHINPDRPALAIITDLARWKFLRLEPNGSCTHSEVFHVKYDDFDGVEIPISDELRDVLERVVGLIAPTKSTHVEDRSL